MSRLQVCDGDKPIYGITVARMQIARYFFQIGRPHDTIMQGLKADYEINKALSERPLNYFDNVYHGGGVRGILS